jgi:hypothetical protein
MLLFILKYFSLNFIYSENWILVHIFRCHTSTYLNFMSTYWIIYVHIPEFYLSAYLIFFYFHIPEFNRYFQLIYCVVENWIASDSGGHSVRKLTGIIYFPKISANFTCVIKKTQHHFSLQCERVDNS